MYERKAISSGINSVLSSIFQSILHSAKQYQEEMKRDLDVLAPSLLHDRRPDSLSRHSYENIDYGIDMMTTWISYLRSPFLYSEAIMLSMLEVPCNCSSLISWLDIYGLKLLSDDQLRELIKYVPLMNKSKDLRILSRIV